MGAIIYVQRRGHVCNIPHRTLSLHKGSVVSESCVLSPTVRQGATEECNIMSFEGFLADIYEHTSMGLA